jgi:hypothetical protein
VTQHGSFWRANKAARAAFYAAGVAGVHAGSAGGTLGQGGGGRGAAVRGQVQQRHSGVGAATHGREWVAVVSHMPAAAAAPANHTRLSCGERSTIDICMAFLDGGQLLLCNLCLAACYIKFICAKKVQNFAPKSELCLLILFATLHRRCFSAFFTFSRFFHLCRANPSFPPPLPASRFLQAPCIVLIMHAAVARRRASCASICLFR